MLKCENQYDQPEGSFTEGDMNRSQQTWVKTFMQDVMDEKGQVLFDNLSWFTKKLCSVMTIVSSCECFETFKRSFIFQKDVLENLKHLFKILKHLEDVLKT